MRNRTRRDPTRFAGQFVVDLAKQLEAGQSELAFVLAAIGPVVDEGFRRQCRVGPVGKGVLTIFVNDAGAVASVRLQWGGAILRSLQQTREGGRIRRVLFEYGEGGTEVLPIDKQNP